LQGSGKTWADCFRCQFSHLSTEHCPPNTTAANAAVLPAPCSAPSFITLDVGNYAAQLSWWFAFFPPDRFLVLLSTDLKAREESAQVAVLNKIKKFATVAGPEFNASALRGAREFSGGYNLDNVDAADVKALLALRLIYRQSLMDLRLLLWKDGHHRNFAGVSEELSAADLKTRLREQFAEAAAAEVRRAAAPPGGAALGGANATAHAVGGAAHSGANATAHGAAAHHSGSAHAASVHHGAAHSGSAHASTQAAAALRAAVHNTSATLAHRMDAATGTAAPEAGAGEGAVVSGPVNGSAGIPALSPLAPSTEHIIAQTAILTAIERAADEAAADAADASTATHEADT